MSTNEKSCFGIGCSQHTLCARYHAVEIEPERARMDSCDAGGKFVMMGSPTPAQEPDDVLRQILWGHG